MAKVTEPLREWIDTMDALGEPCGRLLEIADEIDEEHKHRMWQCEREVRKRLCKDVRWAVNQLESCYARGWIRQQIESGEMNEESNQDD